MAIAWAEGLNWRWSVIWSTPLKLRSWGFPEIKLGCYPPVAATALAALVGQKHAADLILTGRNVTGTEAARIGLANRDLADS